MAQSKSKETIGTVASEFLSSPVMRLVASGPKTIRTLTVSLRAKSASLKSSMGPTTSVDPLRWWESVSSPRHPRIVSTNDQSGVFYERRKLRRETTLKCYKWPPMTMNRERNRREPNRPAGPADRERPRGQENPERLNASQPCGACSQAFV